MNDVPISDANSTFNPRSWNRHRFNVSASGLFRPRFLHPLYSGVNPFDADLDDPQRDQIYENDVITTVTPNHRIQVWDISTGVIPVISNRKYVFNIVLQGLMHVFFFFSTQKCCR